MSIKYRVAEERSHPDVFPPHVCRLRSLEAHELGPLELLALLGAHWAMMVGLEVERAPGWPQVAGSGVEGATDELRMGYGWF